MAKIATDLEQSKQLAEILPIESADMFYYKNIFFGALSVFNGVLLPRGKQEIKEEKMIPAWSLSALLDVLPNNEHIETSISRGSWKIDPVKYLPNIWWCVYEDTKNQTEFNISADNQVDACYEMILKLHEQNLI